MSDNSSWVTARARRQGGELVLLLRLIRRSKLFGRYTSQQFPESDGKDVTGLMRAGPPRSARSFFGERRVADLCREECRQIWLAQQAI